MLTGIEDIISSLHNCNFVVSLFKQTSIDRRTWHDVWQIPLLRSEGHQAQYRHWSVSRIGFLVNMARLHLTEKNTNGVQAFWI